MQDASPGDFLSYVIFYNAGPALRSGWELRV